MIGSSTPLSILLADDDDLVRDLVGMTLEHLGCTVVTAEDGAAALEMLHSRHFDVLVTDWMMPRVDGLELVRRVREQTSLEEYLHIIMMTAKGEEQTVRHALAAGVDDFLQKPVDPLQIELGIASARRVVDLQRRLTQRNRRLADAQARIQADLDAAAEAQQRLLPTPQMQQAIRYGWKVQPSLTIGGDTLNVLPVAPDRLLFFHLDVSGHGIRSALGSFTMNTRISLLAPSKPEQLLDTVAIVNADMTAQQAGESYLTMVAGLVDQRTGEVVLVRAGHPLPLLVQAGGRSEWVEEGGLPLGLFDEVEHSLVRLSLGPGDRLILYSDGVTDSGVGDDQLGEAGLKAFAETHSTQTLPAFLDSLEEMLAQKWNGNPPEDDISVLVIERAPDAERGDTRDPL
jgi:sigma-B regulation protein RsbU (phosphoserine phosphatase)